MEEGKVDAFVKFGEFANSYGKEYTEKDFSKGYPANFFRLKIAHFLLEEIQPKKILDVGCGTGDPLIYLSEQGFDIDGFDYSKEMVQKAKSNLENVGINPEKVFYNNMEDIQGISPSKYDCAIALGSLYYARDFDRAMNQVLSLLPKGGSLILSLRNDLFSLFSMNKYTIHFMLKKLLGHETLPEEEKNKISKYLKDRFLEKDLQQEFKTVDDLNIHSIWHNPLSLEEDILRPHNLNLAGTYFYHFHALPPIFEHLAPLKFRRLSAGMENNPTDWRGHFMCSAFLIRVIKNSN